MKWELNENYLKKELYELIKIDTTLFDFIQEGSLDGMWYWNLEKIEDEWLSPRFWEVLGYDPKDKKHKSSEWKDIIFKDDLKEATDNFNKHLQDPKHPYDQVVRYRHKNGSTVWVRCRGIAIRDENGKAIRMLGAHVNISNEQIEIKRLKDLTIMTESLLIGIGKEIDYQKISDNILEISNAKYAAFNLYDEEGKQYRTKAIAGNRGNINKALDIVGIKLDKRIWKHDPVRANKIIDEIVTHFPTLHDLAGNVIPKSICTLLTKSFGLGETVIVKISKDDIMLGDFTLFMPKGKTFDKDSVVEIYANQLGLVLTNVWANEKLRESEKKYRLLTTQMPLGLALHETICDDEGKPIDYIFISANKNFERLIGLKGEDILGKTVLEVLPGIEKYWIEAYGDVALTGKSIQFENYSKELGKYFNTFAYSPKKGQFAVVVEDITERVLIENQRAKEHRDLLTSQKIAKLGTWRLDVETNAISMSEELYKMHGFDLTQPVPPYAEHMKLFTKQSCDKLSAALALSRTQGIPYELELEMVRDGIFKGWMWARGEAEYDKHGQIVSLTGTTQDITERKQLEQNLKEAHQIALLGRWELIHNEHRFDCSETIFDIFEIDPKRFESSYESLLKLIHPDDRSPVDEAYKRSLVNKQAYSIEHRLLMKDGRIKWVVEKCNTDFDGKGQPIRSVGVVQDITDKKIKEEENIYIANHDYLTNLYNRRYFVKAFSRFVANACYPTVLMMIDINGLKIINDAYGHVLGDEAIRQVANLLMKVFDQDDVVARIGGDEFAILVYCKNASQPQVYKDKLVTLSKDIEIGNIPVSLAIGYEILKDTDKDFDGLLSRVEKQLYRHKLTVGESVRNHSIKAILNTLTDKYIEERIHSERVSQLCNQIGTELGLSKEEVDILKLAGMYHDIGKISIPDAILTKTGKLTDEEFEIVKTHTKIGYQILRAADEYSGLAEYALSHHERWDGKGYPKGLKGKGIPLFSRIISVADSFEAMTADRPYRKAMSQEAAIAEIQRCSGSQFDPEIANIFLEKVLKYKH